MSLQVGFSWAYFNPAIAVLVPEALGEASSPARFQARDRVTQLKVSDGGSTVFMQLDYTYDRASEITGVTDNTYVSDAGVNGVSNPKTITYEYNGNGRLQKAVGPFGASHP